jgi:O-antigen ligase
MPVFTEFFWSKFHRNDASASFRWMLFVAAMFGLMPILGSVLSVIIIGGALVAWFYVFMDFDRFGRLDRRERIIAAIFAGYFAITLFFAIIAPHPIEGLRAVFDNVGFLLLLPLLPVLRASARPYWEPCFLYAIATGGILAGLFAMAAAWMFDIPRPEAISGNPLVFSYLAGTTALWSGWLALTRGKTEKPIFLLGAFLGTIALLLSGGRSPLVFFLLTAMIGIVVWLVQTAGTSKSKAALGLYLIVLSFAGMYQFVHDNAAFAVLTDRLSHLAEAAQDPGDSETGLVERYAMQVAGFQAFTTHPLKGYGRQNVMDAANTQFDDDPHFGYTHLHNAYLTEAVASGVPGLLIFVAVLYTPILAVIGSRGPWTGLGILFCFYTAAFNLTNIGFYHDIKVFHFCMVVIAFSAMAPRKLANDVRLEVDADYRDFLVRQIAIVKGFVT